MRLLRPRIFTGEFSWCLNMWIYSCLCGSSLFGFLGSLGGDIMGPYPRLRDPKALKPSAFRMISWAKSRFFCVISYRGQDDVHRFYYVRMYSWSTCFKCVWWHVRPRGGPHEPRMDIDVLLTYAIPLVKKNLKNNAENVWRLCFITLLLHPHSRENAGTKWWNKLLEKKFRNNLEV